MNKLLRDLQEVVAHSTGGEIENSSLDRLIIEKKLGEFKATIGECNDVVGISIDVLKQKGGSVGESYHWIIFVLIYGGAYIVAST